MHGSATYNYQKIAKVDDAQGSTSTRFSQQILEAGDYQQETSLVTVRCHSEWLFSVLKLRAGEQE